MIMLFIIKLTQAASYNNIWCICIEKKRFTSIKFCQNWSHHQRLFENLKCQHWFFILEDELVFRLLLHIARQGMKFFVVEVHDKSLMIFHHIKEWPQLDQNHKNNNFMILVNFFGFTAILFFEMMCFKKKHSSYLKMHFLVLNETYSKFRGFLIKLIYFPIVL